MPWTAKQVKLFQAAAHNPAIAKQHGLSQQKAGQMAAEGVKPSGKVLAAAVRGRKVG